MAIIGEKSSIDPPSGELLNIRLIGAKMGSVIVYNISGDLNGSQLHIILTKIAIVNICENQNTTKDNNSRIN